MRKRALAAAILAGMATQASAFQLDTNEDWSIRWDNKIKYNVMTRVKSQDSDTTSNPYAADADYSFDKGDIVSNRIDLLSELDVVWKDTVGFRISGAGWYDHAYRNGTNAKGDVPLNAWSTALTTSVGELGDEAEKYQHQGGELLDAFVFWNWNIGDVAGNLRAGRHVIYWGQSLLGTGAVNSAGGAMNPIDISKALAVPGSEAKELFMPTNKISTMIQLTDNLTFSAYYGFEFQQNRFPSGNTYFSPASGFTEAAEVFWLNPGLGFDIQNDEHPEEGEWGVNFAYYFEDLGMEVSAYYLNYHDKQQNGLTAALTPTGAFALSGLDASAGGGVALYNGLDPNAGGAALIGSPIGSADQLDLLAAIGGGLVTQGQVLGIHASGYNDFLTLSDGSAAIHAGSAKWVYKEDIDLYGISVSKQIGDISYGLDITHRRDTPIRVELNSAAARSLLELAGSTAAQTFTLADFYAADEGNYPQNTGDTWHVVVNALGLLNDNGWWEGGSYIIEATFSMVDDIDYGRQPEYLSLVAQDPGNSGKTDVDEGRISSHLAVVFRPTWYQVFPGVDLTVPFAVSVGIDGNGVSTSMGDEESGAATIGLDFSVNQKWNASIKYSNFFGPNENSFGNLLKDRDNVAITFKRTF